jgi:hypothetical protein
MQFNGFVWRQRQHDEALAPMPLFAARRLAYNAHGRSIAIVERQPRQSPDNRLQLIVIGRAIC